MAGAFVKVFGSILTSSVWCENDATVRVWLTMLVLADGEGKVWGAIPGIARVSGVTLEAGQAAIAKLCEPDPFSRTADEEGRRLIAIDGGWFVVNHRKYREMQTDGQRKASMRSKRYRKNKKQSGGDDDSGAAPAAVTPLDGGGSGGGAAAVTQRDERDPSRPSRTEEESEGEERTDNRLAPARAVAAVFSHWRTVLEHPTSKLTKDRASKIRARLRDGYTVEQLQRAVDGCKASRYHMGENEQSTVYDSVDLIFRNGAKVEQFLGYAERPPTATLARRDSVRQFPTKAERGDAATRQYLDDRRRREGAA